MEKPSAVTTALLVIVSSLIVLAVFSAVLMVLWNWAVKNAIPGVNRIDFFVALGLLLFMGLFVAPTTIMKQRS